MTDTQRLADDCFFAYYVDDATDEKKTGQNNISIARHLNFDSSIRNGNNRARRVSRPGCC